MRAMVETGGLWLAGLLALAARAPAALVLSQAQQAEESCVECHGAEGQMLARSRHSRAGVGCTACHGGVAGTLDKDEAHGEALRSLRDPLESVESCGGCHADTGTMRRFGLRTDQLALYWTSRHGERLRAEGDLNVATCVSCHGSHGILGPNDPRSPVHPFNTPTTCGRCHSDPELMESYGLKADEGELYRRSVHGRALIEEGHLSSPGCANCHGSHGATPPRVEEVGGVCGQCHSVVQDYFEEGAHMRAAEKGLMEECVSCHGNHLVTAPSVAMFLGDEPGHCGSCHRDEDDPGLQVARSFHERLGKFDDRIRETEEALVRAAASGLFIDREHGYLEEAQGLRVRARTLTHALSEDALVDLLNRGRAMIQETVESLEVKNRALRDRKIFTSIFLAVVLVLAAVLLTYRHEISGGRGTARRAAPVPDQEGALAERDGP